MKITFFYIALITILVACGETEKSPDSNVYEIRNIGELSTTEYTVGKIIKLDDESEEWYEYGDRKILISCRARIKAGVDLSKIKEGDIKVKGTTIEIKLPPAKVNSLVMDPSDINTEIESVTGFRSSFTQNEKNDFLKQGEAAILEDLKKTGILDDANENAEAFLIDFYKQLGYEKVIVKYSE